MQLRNPLELPQGVDEFQEQFVLSAFPPGSAVEDVETYRPGYKYYPVRVTVRVPNGQTCRCVLKIDRFDGGFEIEARLLPVLRDLGLPVPETLAGPTPHPDFAHAGPVMVLSELPGEPITCRPASLAEADLGCRLLMEGLDRLQALTEGVRRSSAAALLPEHGLMDEYDEVVRTGGPWLETPWVRERLGALRDALRRTRTPRVFTSGDANCLNYLQDGERLTGWIDFTHACFEDPLIGLVKYVVWAPDNGWCWASQCGLIERYLHRHGLTHRDFAPRLALRGLTMAMWEAPDGPGDSTMARHVEAVLRTALEDLEGDQP